MKTNKTPIQELIDYFYEQQQMSHYAMISETFRSVIAELEEAKQKEKQFAFDCFEAGRILGSIGEYDGMSEQDPTEQFAFDKFYAKYADR